MKIGKNITTSGRKMHPDLVQDYQTLLDYAHQMLGTPYPLAKEHAGVRKVVKQFMEEYPDTGSYQALTDVVRWAKHRKKHLSMVQLFSSYRYAYQDGFMIILDRGDMNDDTTLVVILKNVTDEAVRTRMIAATTAGIRNQIYNTYLEEQEWETPEPEEPKDQPLLQGLGLYIGQPVQYRVTVARRSDLGTVLGEDGDNVIVYDGINRSIAPNLIRVRRSGEWVSI